MAEKIKIEKNYERVIVCGMGGSSVAGEILLFWQEASGMPLTFHIHRDYDLPSWISENDLVVCISWSGNTEETISSYESAVKNNIPVASIATGGKLGELSNKNGTPFVLIPNKNLQPRMGAGYMTTALFQILGLGEKIASTSLNAEKAEEKGKNMADEINNAAPLLYSSYKWKIIPKFWKILFNENCKIHSFWNYLPGMAHNELAGFTRRPETSDKRQGKDFYPIFFKDPDDDPRQNKNVDTAIAILKKIGYNCNIVSISPNKKPLEAVLEGYVLGLWTSYYLAKKMVVDPEDIKLIEKYKRARKQL